jgi:hypothetical protein
MLLLVVVVQITAYDPHEIISGLGSIALEELVLVMVRIFVISDGMAATIARGDIKSLNSSLGYADSPSSSCGKTQCSYWCQHRRERTVSISLRSVYLRQRTKRCSDVTQVRT